MFAYRLFGFVSALVCGAHTSAAAAMPQGPRGTAPQTIRPNVLLIVLDDLGLEKLGFYEYWTRPLDPSCNTPLPQAPPPTPALDQVAGSGVWFRNAYAHPLCSSSRAAILTGRYPFLTGMGHLSDMDNYTLPASEWTIARMLKAFTGGPTYRCGAFGKWHLSGADVTPPVLPVDRGFDYFAGTWANVGGSGNHFDWTFLEADSVQVFAPAPVGNGMFTESTYTASYIGERARQWIANVPEPFFAYVCFHPPHAPFQVPPLSMVSDATKAQIHLSPYDPGDIPPLTDPAGMRLAYDWMIEAVDYEVGRMMDAVASRLDHTTVLIVGDNGTPGPVIQAPYSASHAKGTIYEQGVRVPLLAKGFKVSTAGVPHDGVVHVVDLWRTVAAITGAPLPGVPNNSFNLKQVLANPGQVSSRPPVLSQLFVPAGPYDPMAPLPSLNVHMRAMSDGVFKYLRCPDSPTVSEEAYRLTTDPTECVDLWPVLGSLPPADQARILNLRDELIVLSGD